MSKLRIGLIVNANSTPTEGGGHSYFDMLLKGINEFNFSPDIEIVNIVFYNASKPQWKSAKPCIYVKVGYSMKLKIAMKQKSTRLGLAHLNRRHPIIDFVVKSILRKRNRRVEKILRENEIDLIYYLKPEFDVLDYPFIATHWDVAHRSVSSFPDVIRNGEYETRENYYLYTLNKAFLILCESETGANELKRYYAILEEKIKVLPMFAGNTINEKSTPEYEQEVLSKYKLQKNKFFLYPAQFWALKNHYNLLVAFEKLIKETTTPKNVKLVLSGSDKGNAAYINRVAQSLSLQDHVIFPGFVPDAELHVLYRNAIALTMVTFLGPTNLPLLEAAHLNCPVICSNLEGHKELLQTSALYVDPTNADAIKEAMEQLLDENKRDALRHAAHAYILQSPFNLQKSLHVLNDVLLQTIPRRKTWGH